MTVVVGGWLDQIVMEGFSNRNYTMIVFSSTRGLVDVHAWFQRESCGRVVFYQEVLSSEKMSSFHNPLNLGGGRGFILFFFFFFC